MDLNNITILCVSKYSNYRLINGLDIYDEKRNAFTFNGKNKVISHAPCAQWSRMKGFAKRDKEAKKLSNFCFDLVIENGGIFEHPAGSSFFKYRNIVPTCEINQQWYGFPARKATWLYFNKCTPKPVAFIPNISTKQVNQMDKEYRTKMPLTFCIWLLDCIKNLK